MRLSFQTNCGSDILSTYYAPQGRLHWLVRTGHCVSVSMCHKDILVPHNHKLLSSAKSYRSPTLIVAKEATLATTFAGDHLDILKSSITILRIYFLRNVCSGKFDVVDSSWAVCQRQDGLVYIMASSQTNFLPHRKLTLSCRESFTSRRRGCLTFNHGARKGMRWTLRR